MIAFLVLFITSCRSTRLLRDDQTLITKVKLEGIDNKFEEEASVYIQKEVRPNSSINLFIYNFANSKDGHYRTENIRNVGEAPHLLDSSLIEISRNQIERFFVNKGYFNVQVEDSIVVKKKKARITFHVNQGDPFFVKNVEYKIADPAIDSLYNREKSLFTRIHEGMRYDSDSLVLERENFYNLSRRSGYFDFLRQYVRFEVDS